VHLLAWHHLLTWHHLWSSYRGSKSGHVIATNRLSERLSDRVTNIDNLPSIDGTVSRNASAIQFSLENHTDGNSLLDRLSPTPGVGDDTTATFRLNARKVPGGIRVLLCSNLLCPPAVNVFSLEIKAKGFVIVKDIVVSGSVSPLDAQLQIFGSQRHRTSDDLVPFHNLVAFARSLLLKNHAFISRSKVHCLVQSKLGTIC